MKLHNILKAGACSLAVIAAHSGLAQEPLQRGTPTTTLHCGHLIDTLQGKLLGQTTVTIIGNRIATVTPGISASDTSGATIDLTHATCMPGLSDMHVHLSQQADLKNSFTEVMTLNEPEWVVHSTVYARRTLMAGFTTVRDLGDTNYEVIGLRNGINSGWIPGPRIFAAGPALGSTGGHADPTDGLNRMYEPEAGPEKGMINSTEDAWKAVRMHYKQNIDVIKVVASGGVQDESESVDNPQLTEEEIAAVVKAAHDYGFTVGAHAHGPEAMRRAVLGGVDSIEHGTFMTEAVMDLMKARGTYFVPTMYTATFVTEKTKQLGAYSPTITRKALMVGPQIMQTVHLAYQHGVRFAYGTDEGVFPHGENWRDFPLMVQAGIPAMTAIQSATINAARLIKKDKDLGSITTGKFADIVAIDGDPLSDMQRMGNVAFVLKNGLVYKQQGKETLPNTAP